MDSKPCMKFIFLLLMTPVICFAQTQGVSMRATNGVSFGRMTVNSHINATNSSTTNTFAGNFQQGSGVANGNGAAAFGLNTRASGSYAFVTGIGNNSAGPGSLTGGNSNTVSSSATSSLVGGFNNTVSGLQNFAVGSNNYVAGAYGAAIGRDLLFDAPLSSALGNTLAVGRDILVRQDATNSFIFNGGSTTFIADSHSNAFWVNAPGGIFFSGAPITGNGAGLTNLTQLWDPVNGGVVLANSSQAIKFYTNSQSPEMDMIAPNGIDILALASGNGIGNLYITSTNGDVTILDPYRSSGSVPYSFDTAKPHSTGNIFASANNGTNKFTVGWNGAVTAAGVYTGDVSGATNANATTLFGSGFIPTLRLGSGTANSGSILFGDQSFKALTALPAPVVITNAAIANGANYTLNSAGVTWTNPAAASQGLNWNTNGGLTVNKSITFAEKPGVKLIPLTVSVDSMEVQGTSAGSAKFYIGGSDRTSLGLAAVIGGDLGFMNGSGQSLLWVDSTAANYFLKLVSSSGNAVWSVGGGSGTTLTNNVLVLATNGVKTAYITFSTNGFSSFATDTGAIASTSNWTNTFGKDVTAYVATATDCTLKNASATTLVSFGAVASYLPVHLQAGWYLTGTAIVGTYVAE